MTCDIIHVVGARPNFAKMAPVYKALKNLRVSQKILHSGQHYDHNMSGSFFKDLDIPEPDIQLSIKGKTQGQQTGEVLEKIETALFEAKPRIVCVYGDINTTVAAALSAKKFGAILAHIESGLRSFDTSMPEEINRMVVDAISDIHFVTEDSGVKNLTREGKEKSVHFVGNTMIDSLKSVLSHMKKENSKSYGVVTFHRPANVDTKEGILKVLETLDEIETEVYWPIHPRTLKSLKKFRCLSRVKRNKKIKLIDPMPYKDFISLVYSSAFILTDSGGIQEEATFMKVPCLTFRENTERPSTISFGTNVLVSNKHQVAYYLNQIAQNSFKTSSIPDFWDGTAGERIAIILKKVLLIN